MHSGHALSFRPVSQETKDEYIRLFENGNFASSARHAHVRHLQLEHDGKPDTQRLLANRSTTPNVLNIQRLFRNCRESTEGAENGKAMFERLDDEVNRYNKTIAADGGQASIEVHCNSETKTEWTQRTARTCIFQVEGGPAAT